MTALNPFDLEKVTGGKQDEEYTFYWDTIIFLWKKTGKSLEELLSNLIAQDRPQAQIDYIAANWSKW